MLELADIQMGFIRGMGTQGNNGNKIARNNVESKRSINAIIYGVCQL